MKLELGKKFPIQCKTGENGVVVETIENTILYVYHMDMPSAKEKEVFQKGKAEFRFFKTQNILFFLSKIGELGWTDAPFHQPLYKDRYFGEYPESDEGFGIVMVLVNSRNNIVEGMRLKSLTNLQSRYLVDAISAQEPILNLDSEIRRIYEKFPTSTHMALRSET